MPGNGIGEDAKAAKAAAKEIAKNAKDAAKIYASGGTDVSAWWSLFKRWIGRIIKGILALVLVFLQIIAAVTSPAGSCGAGGGSTALPDYATGGTGSTDQEVARIVYDAVKERYGNNPDGNRVLLAAFEAGLAESNMRNLEGGDRDSVGVYQQRATWGSFEQRTNPTWAVNKFLTELETQRKNHPNYEAHELAQATQRSWCTQSPPAASQPDCHGIFGGNYLDEQQRAQQLIDAMGGNFDVPATPTAATVGDGNAATTADNTVTPDATGACDTPGSFGNGGLLAGQNNVTVNSPNHGEFTIDVIPNGSRGAVISAAMTQLGVTYVYGGNTWREGATGGALDCSSFVLGALKRGANIDIPRTSKAQYAALPRKYENKGQLLPGDLIFYSDSGSNAIHHVTMYLGLGKVGNSTTSVPLVIAAPSTGDVVKIQPYYVNGNMFFGDPGYTDTPNAQDAPTAGVAPQGAVPAPAPATAA